MAVITYPSGLRVKRQDFGQRRFDLSFAAGDSGAQQTRVLAPPRWTCSLIGEEQVPAEDAATWRKLLMGLRGRVNQLEVYDLLNTAPRGTARGSWVVTAPGAVGATSLAIQSRRARVNLLSATEAFENAYWIKTTGGTGSLPVVTANAATDPLGGSTADRVVFDKGAGTTSTDQSSLYAGGVSTVTGQQYVFSVWLKTEDGSTKAVRIDFAGLGGTNSLVSVTGTWQRFETYMASAIDTSRRPHIRLRGALGTADTATLHVWGAQFEIAATSTAYQRVDVDGSTFDAVDYDAGAGKTILTGDWIGVNQAASNRQLLHVQSDVTLDASAAGVLTFEPPLRTAVAADSTMVWDKPTCLMRLADAESRWSSVRPRQGGFAAELLESWE